MFGLSSIASSAIAGVIILGMGFTAGFKVEDWHCAAQQKAAIEAGVQEYKDEAAAANLAASKLEAQLAALQQTQRKVGADVDRIAAKPLYRGTCFDADGVRAANAALTGQTADTGRPNGAVSRPDAPAKRKAR